MPTTNYYDRYNAQDYGRGYGGRSNYYQGYTPQGIISMFDPGSMDMIAQAASSRQQRFDAGSTAIAQERARIAGMETADPQEASKQLKSFEEKLNEKIQGTYGGDYGAAVNAITNMIGAERANPFYKYNAAKVKALDLEQKTRMAMGADYMAAKSPMDISFEDYKKGQTDFGFTPVNRQTIVKRSSDVFSQYAKQIMNNPEFRSTEGGKFLERMVQYGFTDAEGMQNFINENPSIVEDIMNTPGLEGLDEGAVREAIMEGAHAGIGQSQMELRADPAYLNRLEEARLAGLGADADEISSTRMVPKEFSKVPLTKNEIINRLDTDTQYKGSVDDIQKIGESYGINITSFKDLMEFEKAIKRIDRMEALEKFMPGTPAPTEAVTTIVNALGKIGNFINPFTPLTTDQDLIQIKEKTSPAHQFLQEADSYIDQVGEQMGVALMYDIDQFSSALSSKDRGNTKEARRVVNDELQKQIISKKEGFVASSGNARDTQKISEFKNVEVTGISYDAFSGELYVNINGTNPKDETKSEQIILKDRFLTARLVGLYKTIETKSQSPDRTWRNIADSLITQ